MRHKGAVNHESANTQRRQAVTAVPEFQVSKISASQPTATTGPAATVAASRGRRGGKLESWKPDNLRGRASRQVFRFPGFQRRYGSSEADVVRGELDALRTLR